MTNEQDITIATSKGCQFRPPYASIFCFHPPLPVFSLFLFLFFRRSDPILEIFLIGKKFVERCVNVGGSSFPFFHPSLLFGVASRVRFLSQSFHHLLSLISSWH